LVRIAAEKVPEGKERLVSRANRIDRLRDSRASHARSDADSGECSRGRARRRDGGTERPRQHRKHGPEPAHAAARLLELIARLRDCALHRRKAAKLLEVAKLVTKLADLLDHGHVAKLPELLLKRAEVCLRFPVLCGIERALHALLERVEASLKRCEPHRLDAAAD